MFRILQCTFDRFTKAAVQKTAVIICKRLTVYRRNLVLFKETQDLQECSDLINRDKVTNGRYHSVRTPILGCC